MVGGGRGSRGVGLVLLQKRRPPCMEAVLPGFFSNHRSQQMSSASAPAAEPPATIDGIEVVNAVRMGSPPQPAHQTSTQEESTTATSSSVGGAGPSDITIAIVPAPEGLGSDGDAAIDTDRGECVICLTELSESPTSTLICNHTFHQECVTEWLDKDGRCPTCRRQIRAITPAQIQHRGGDAHAHAAMHSMATMMLESRRLMMLATMEAALAVRARAPRVLCLLATTAAAGAVTASAAATSTGHGLRPAWRLGGQAAPLISRGVNRVIPP